MDPLTNSYPWYTPYQFAGNKPINSIDLDGLESEFCFTLMSIQDHYDKMDSDSEYEAKYHQARIKYLKLNGYKEFQWVNKMHDGDPKKVQDWFFNTLSPAESSAALENIEKIQMEEKML